MADHPLEQLNPDAPHGSDGASSTVRIRKHDVIRNAPEFSKSETKEVKPKSSNQQLNSRPASQQSTTVVSVVSQVNHYPSYDNTI
ncbi:hypothetical protein BGZ96_008925 [Linnemannia gamsii]|uniref:Uncharacterized protein n=1 Tax=Linnemannia gamsii TaxID=64522 RepID=A0ABQ7JXY8_9FUNG|nr:hypothetical protein BGZ96_008925 [Linnemannia gamsii]